jgi:predicted DNA-binding transcriptional regulator YafY
MANNLFERIKQTIDRFSATLPAYKQPKPLPPEPQPEEVYGYTEREIGYIPHAEMMSAIIKAARTQRLLYIRYNGKWRHIEPYELKNGKRGSMIWAWCLIDNEIHTFYIFKTQEMHLTDVPFTARFPIKI